MLRKSEFNSALKLNQSVRYASRERPNYDLPERELSGTVVHPPIREVNPRTGRITYRPREEYS